MISEKLKTQADINAAIERAEKAKKKLQVRIRIDELKEENSYIFLFCEGQLIKDIYRKRSVQSILFLNV